MPRIPQGNFDSTPSMDVPQAKIMDIEPIGARTLRQVGSASVAVANKWSMINQKVEALGGVAEAEDSVNFLDDNLKKYQADAVMGKLSDGRSVASAMKEDTDALLKEHRERIGDNPIAIEAFNQMVIPKIERLNDKSFAFETKQIVSGTDKMLSDSLTNLAIRQMHDDVPEREVAEVMKKLELAQDIIGRERALALAAMYNKNVALHAGEKMRSTGWSPEEEAKARKKMNSGSLTSGERAVAEHKFNESMRVGQAVTLNKAQKATKELIDKTKGIDSYNVSKNNFLAALGTLQQVPLIPGESQEMRDAQISEVASTIVSFEVASFNGNILNDNNRDYAQQTSEKLNEIMGGRGLASADGDNPIYQRALYKLSAMRQKINSKGGSYAAFAETNPNIEILKRNGNMDAVVSAYDAFANANNVPSYNRTVMGVDEADSYGKMFDELQKGKADPTGGKTLDLFKNIKSTYGTYTGQAIQDLLSEGGGNKSGSTKVPSVIAMVPYMKDDSQSKFLIQQFNRKEENAAALKMKDPKYASALDAAIASRSGVDSLQHGIIADNDLTAKGYADSMRALSLGYMNEGDSPTEAVDRARGYMANHMILPKDKNNSAMVPVELLKTKDATVADVEYGMDLVRNPSHLFAAGFEIDIDAMNPNITGMGTSLTASFNRISAEKDPAKRARLTNNYLGKHIVSVNDPTQPGSARLYLKVNDTNATIPIYFKGKDGKTTHGIVDIVEYGKERNAARELEESTWQGRTQAIADQFSAKQQNRGR